MSVFFISIYHFFKKYKFLFYLLLFAIPLLSFYYLSKINLEEDISKAAPGTDTKLTFVLKQLKATDKIILTVYSPDTTAVPNTDKLISFADELLDILKSKSFTPSYINSITGKINDSLMNDLLDVFYNNLPVFLNESDYNKIDSLISPAAIENSLKKNYKTLLSPASFAFKKFIKRDPVGISALAYDKLKQLQFDESYNIQNGYIFSGNNRNLLLFINPANPSNKTAENTQFVEKLDKLINELSSKYKGTVNAEYYGAAAVAAGNATQIKKDVILSVVIALIIIMVFVGWYFKKLSAPFLSFLPAVFGGAIALAVIFIFRTNISVIALAIGSVLLGIIVDYALYIFSNYKIKSSFEEVLKDMSLTITLCSLTTAIAFFSLLFVKSEVLQDLGLFAGLSVLGAALFALVFLPHLLKWKKKPVDNNIKSHTIIDKIAAYPFENNRILIIFILLVFVVMLFSYRKVGFETDMYKMNFLSDKMAKAEKDINKLNDISLKSVYVVSTGKNLNQALTLNSKLTGTLEDLKKQNVIKKYASVSSILISDTIQKARINKWNSYWTKDKKRKLIETITSKGEKDGFSKNAFNDFYALLDKDFHSSKRNALENKIIKQFLSERISETPDLSMVVNLIKVNKEDREKIFSTFSGMNDVVVFDKLKITSNFVESIRTDFNLLVNLCLIFVTLSLIIFFGRIEIGLIASVPMFVSWLFTLGIMGMSGLTFNIFNIIISTFIFGLGVDYSILMVRGLLLDYKYGQKELPSYKTSIFLSAFTTIVGVGVLGLAKHPSLNSIALIAVIGLFSVVLIAYTIVPILFRFLVTKKSKKRIVPITLEDLFFTANSFLIFFTGCLSLNILLPVFFILPLKKATKKLIMHYMMMGVCWIEVYFSINIKKRIINLSDEDFKKPAIIIANHQSHIDLLLLLMLYPKIIVLTNNWVWNNPFYSLIIRYLDFYPVSEGYEEILERLKSRVDEGYSIAIFPEGSRSENCRITRFHKGAFVLAERLNMDIIPLIMHGSGDCMSKGENYLKTGRITMKIFPRIKPDDTTWGIDYSQRSKATIRFFRAEYTKMVNEFATPAYYKNKLAKNYIYKSPILEWYLKVKVKLEKNYELFNNIIPYDAEITDIGCGYGFLDYMLSFVSEKRKITGIDYDEEKINVANNCISKNAHMNFVFADALEYGFNKSDVFIMCDILHYIDEEKQQRMIIKCINNLKENGIIIIREADNKLVKRHRGTVFTEFFSINTGFNKLASKKICFTSGDSIKKIVVAHNMQLQIVDNTKFTSNIIYIIKK